MLRHASSRASASIRALLVGALHLAGALPLAACGDDDDATGAGGAGATGGGDGGGATVTAGDGATATASVTAGPGTASSSASSSSSTSSSTTSSSTTTGSGCVPDTCPMVGAQCGTLSNGCGGTLDCGGCPGDMTCNDETNQCECLCGCTDWVKTTLLDDSSPGFAAAAAPDGTEYAVAYDGFVADYVLFRRPSGGTFSRTILPDTIQEQRPGLALDASGVAHVAYGDKYARVALDGTITTEFIRPMNVARVAVASDGTVHVVGYDFYPFVSEFESTVVHQERSPDGTWTLEELDVVDNPTDTGVLLAKLGIALLSDGTLHVFYDGQPVRHAWRTDGGAWQLELLAADSDSASVDVDGGGLRGLYRDAPSFSEGTPVEFVQLTGESPNTTPIPEAQIMTGFSSIDVDGDDIHVAYGTTPEFDAAESVLRYGVRGKLDAAYTFEEVEVSSTARQTHATVVVTPDGPRVYYSKDLRGLFVATRCP